ncbi:MAG TPA: Rrf2 family transcriptional regulator [Solirubrobacteraceae bacterium]|jgi:Rrf2 family protein|nr:Rrf2 family transcriptional regulator [Solirubrobacteraceae bacterium]
MRVSAKVDYAVRAAVELAAAQSSAEPARPVKAEALARSQDIPVKFLENILQGLRQAGIVDSRRGPEGGHLLARPAAEIALADVIRAIDGPLAGVGGRSPDQLHYAGSAEPMREIWIAVRASLRRVLDEVTLADVAAGRLPAHVTALTEDPGAWAKR